MAEIPAQNKSKLDKIKAVPLMKSGKGVCKTKRVDKTAHGKTRAIAHKACFRPRPDIQALQAMRQTRAAGTAAKSIRMKAKIKADANPGSALSVSAKPEKKSRAVSVDKRQAKAANPAANISAGRPLALL